MTVLFLTNNPNLGSTSRILQSWLLLGPAHGLRGVVVGRAAGDLADWLARHDLPCLVDPMPWPDWRRPYRAVWHAYRVARWAKAHKVEIIHCNEHDLYPFVRLLRRFLALPTVCYVRYRVDRAFAAWCFGGAGQPHLLLWTSEQQKADSAEAVAGLVPEEHQHVLHLGVDLSAFGHDPGSGPRFRAEHGIGDDELVVATASPLRPRKRVEDFIALMRMLAPEHPEVVGIIAGAEIAGDEEYRARIERDIADSGLGRRLRWVGNLEPVEPLHAACDISVSTSEYETFGNSVCEAMACAKPVAAYAGGSVAEVVGDTGVVVETGNLEELRAAVSGLIDDERLRHRLGAAAKERVRQVFSPEQGLKKLLVLYRTLVQQEQKDRP